ncbi:unnamed protein product [Calypogeia fissa]
MMAAVQEASTTSKSTRWQVVHVLGEEELEPTTVNVLAAKIDPKTANTLIRELNSTAPLPSLSHVKRVQRTKKEGGLELSIILCTDDRVEVTDEIVLPSEVSEIAARYCLQPFTAAVSGQPAKSREEWEVQCQLWPTSFHPNTGKPGANAEISEADADTMCYFMEKAIEQARRARQLGQFANGAIIVDPALRAIVARGCDGTAAWCGSLYRGSHCCPGSQSEEKADLPLNDGWHPLQHAIMDAIQRASERDKRLWPADTKATQGNIGGNEYSSVLSHKRRSSEDGIEAGSVVVGADLSLTRQLPEVSGEAPSFEISRPYLCTNFDLYVTREPCTMCAMAMVHQRLRRVIYGIPNALVGALGSRYKLHGLPSLNHHYTVFQISLSEADLL